MLRNQTLEVPQLAKNHAQSLVPAPDDLAENRRVIGYQQCEEVWDMARADKAKPAPVSDRSIILQGRTLSRSSTMPHFRTRFRAATRLSMTRSVAARSEQRATNLLLSGASMLIGATSQQIAE